MVHKRHPAPTGAATAPSTLHPSAAVGPPTPPARTTTTSTVAPGENTTEQRKYLWDQGFDLVKFETGFKTKFKSVAKYDERSIPNLETLLGFIQADPAMHDIRWIAYMLATAFWETSHIETIHVPKTDKKGKALTDKQGKVITRKRSIWINMGPVLEVGGGANRKYHRPVKVAKLPSGEVQVTEYDGDQWMVDAHGKSRSAGNQQNPKLAVAMGTASDAPATEAYKKAAGTEHLYIGRGYVQLTWWNNYATAGVLLDKGVGFFLDDPEQALDAAWAYALMSICMRTGVGFANNHKFDDFFSGNNRNYLGARRMVNGLDNNGPIAHLAELFEDVLWDARMLPD